jgi:hypothetical protein
MRLRLISYDSENRCAVLAAGPHALGDLKVQNVTRAQAEELAEKLSRHWQAANEKRGTPAGVYLTR